jgi:hypothetical protein
VIKPYFKVSLRLDLVTPLEPNEQGYSRVNTDTIVDLALLGNDDEAVLRQTREHVDVLLSAFASTKDAGQ